MKNLLLIPTFIISVFAINPQSQASSLGGGLGDSQSVVYACIAGNGQPSLFGGIAHIEEIPALEQQCHAAGGIALVFSPLF